MAEKILSLVLCVLFIIPAAGCKKANPSDQVSGTENSTSVSSTEASSTVSEAGSKTPETSSAAPVESSTTSDTGGETSAPGTTVEENAPEYLKQYSEACDILKNDIGKGKITTCTALTVSGYKLSLKLPDKVKSRFVGTKEKADSPRYKIMLNDILAGECYFNSKDLPENTEIISSEPNTVTATVDVNKLSLRYKGKASSWEVPVYQIYVRNQRASQFAMIYFRQDMFSYETITEMAKWFDFGYLPETSRAGEKDYSKQSCRILMLGNSFLASSQIGEILQSMANESKVKLTVDVDCRANSNVEHFASDPNVLQKLKDGIYDIVFLCGFYNNRNAQLEIMLNAKSDSTRIIIFPAHNESYEYPYTTRALYPETGLLDWKGFINKLIDMGMDYPRMCMDDGPKHSTNLAGYAGACMIYSFLYKKAVEKGTSESMVIYEQTTFYGASQEQVLKDLETIRKAAYDYLYN